MLQVCLPAFFWLQCTVTAKFMTKGTTGTRHSEGTAVSIKCTIKMFYAAYCKVLVVSDIVWLLP